MTRTSAAKKAKPQGEVRFGDNGNNDAYDRHLVLDHVVSVEQASQRERFEAVARSLRDLLTERWLLTQETYDRENPKRVYYLSMEFLMGRALVNNIINLGVEQFVRSDLQSDPRQDWKEVVETEPDAGLGNGGLGRLAACFVDSLATLQIPAVGYGLRYEYGIFRQAIDNGFQVEHPDHWLAQPDRGRSKRSLSRASRQRSSPAAPSVITARTPAPRRRINMTGTKITRRCTLMLRMPMRWPMQTQRPIPARRPNASAAPVVLARVFPLAGRIRRSHCRRPHRSGTLSIRRSS